MKSCIEWRNTFKYFSQVDEFNIDFRNKEVQLLKFLNQYAINQRVNIRVPLNLSEVDVDLITSIVNTNKYNIAICFNKDYNVRIIDNVLINRFRECNVPFYFEYPVDNYDELYGLIDLGVCDIFISGDLGFDLYRVSAITKKNNIQLRCYVNICQSRWPKARDSFKEFFIRPEDIDIYGNYIDVIEFYKKEHVQNTMYEIYFQSKEWNGGLEEIIDGLNIHIDNYYIMGSEFGRRRSQCQRKCLKSERCELCERVKELADTIEKSKDYEVFKERY